MRIKTSSTSLLVRLLEGSRLRGMQLLRPSNRKRQMRKKRAKRRVKKELRKLKVNKKVKVLGMMTRLPVLQLLLKSH